MPKIIQLTDSQSDYLNQYLGVRNDPIVARDTGLNLCYVSELRRGLKIKPAYLKTWTKEMEDSILPLVIKYMDRHKVASILNVSPAALSAKMTKLRHRGIDFPKMYRTVKND